MGYEPLAVMLAGATVGRGGGGGKGKKKKNSPGEWAVMLESAGI